LALLLLPPALTGSRTGLLCGLKSSIKSDESYVFASSLALIEAFASGDINPILGAAASAYTERQSSEMGGALSQAAKNSSSAAGAGAGAGAVTAGAGAGASMSAALLLAAAAAVFGCAGVGTGTTTALAATADEPAASMAGAAGSTTTSSAVAAGSPITFSTGVWRMVAAVDSHSGSSSTPGLASVASAAASASTLAASSSGSSSADSTRVISSRFRSSGGVSIVSYCSVAALAWLAGKDEIATPEASACYTTQITTQ
tara:strand:- start:253 stop:1026 length:774 start_codon:yes stop_codon:yes gene_type:complete